MSGTISYDGADGLIGSSGAGFYFTGSLDDVRVYDRALSISEINSLYQSEVSSLIAYYPFNGNANDETGNGNDGTENGNISY